MGFLRNVALAAALGTGLVSDSYNLANQVPYQIFLLLGGGTIAAVFLPQLARLSARSQADADRYGTVLLIGSTIFGVAVSALMVAFASQLVALLGGQDWGGPQQHLTIVLFIWCIPQIAAHAIYVVASQLMNVRGKFTLVSWLPSISSVTVILSSIVVITNGSVEANDPGGVASATIALLGASTLGGTFLQTIVVIIFLRRVGFRPRVRGGLKGLGLRAALVTGILAVSSAMCYQITNLLTAAWTAQAGAQAASDGFDGRGYSAFFYAMALVAAIQGVAGASLASILLQRMSKHFANGDDWDAHRELDDASVRLSSLTIPATAVLMATGPSLAVMLFARGETSTSAALTIGVVLSILGAGLIPFAWHAILIRPFYAKHDAWRPLISAVNVNTVWALGACASFIYLQPEFVVFGMAATFSISYWVDLPIKFRMLRSRLHYGMDRDKSQDIKKAILAAIALTFTVGTLGYLSIFSFGISSWLVFLFQIIVICCLYAVAVRNTTVSPMALLRWLRV